MLCHNSEPPTPPTAPTPPPLKNRKFFTIAPSLPGGSRNSQTENAYEATNFTLRVLYLTCVNLTSAKLRNILNLFFFLNSVTRDA